MLVWLLVACYRWRMICSEGRRRRRCVCDKISWTLEVFIGCFWVKWEWKAYEEGREGEAGKKKRKGIVFNYSSTSTHGISLQLIQVFWSNLILSQRGERERARVTRVYTNIHTRVKSLVDRIMCDGMGSGVFVCWERGTERVKGSPVSDQLI